MFGKLFSKRNSSFIALILAFTLACPFVYADDVVKNENSIRIKCADVNYDKKIDAADALTILKYSCKCIHSFDNPHGTEGTPEYIGDVRLGDVSADNIISAEDALLVLKYAAKLIDRFPIEDLIQETETPSDTPDCTYPTETPSSTEGTEPVPIESETPIPTEDVDISLPEWIISLNNCASYDANTGVITFLEVGDNTEGVEVVNPFIGQEGTLGGTFSFWMTSPNTNTYGEDYGYDSLLSIVNMQKKQIVKYDIQGTRQYSNSLYDEKLSMNYWNAYLPLESEVEAFITCVVCYEGVKMYCNGKEIGHISYSGADDAQCRTLITEMLAYEDTRIFLGGTAEVSSGYMDICKHSLPAGVKIWDYKTYNYSMTADEAKQLYNTSKEEAGIETPTPEPTLSPEEKTAPVEVEIISLNDVATFEEGTFTFTDSLGYENGVEITNPLAGCDPETGGTFSFWFTPATTYNGQKYTYTSLLMLVNPEATQLLKFDCEGTRQYQHTTNSKKMNYYATDAVLSEGTEYFITVTVHPEGLDYYINGEKLVVGDWYSKEDQGNARRYCMQLLAAEDTRVFIGGSGCVPQKHLSLVKHKLPAGTKVRDFYGYKSVLTDEQIKELYENSLESK